MGKAHQAAVAAAVAAGSCSSKIPTTRQWRLQSSLHTACIVQLSQQSNSHQTTSDYTFGRYKTTLQVTRCMHVNQKCNPRQPACKLYCTTHCNDAGCTINTQLTSTLLGHEAAEGAHDQLVGLAYKQPLAGAKPKSSNRNNLDINLPCSLGALAESVNVAAAHSQAT
jgi:hypothetical protein